MKTFRMYASYCDAVIDFIRSFGGEINDPKSYQLIDIIFSSYNGKINITNYIIEWQKNDTRDYTVTVIDTDSDEYKKECGIANYMDRGK